MYVVNDGVPCEIGRDIGGTPATTLIVHQKPEHGVLSTEAAVVRYTPSPDFTGTDFFEVEFFGVPWGPYSPAGMKLNLRATIVVTVRGKGEALNPK
jgi:hypothetical protein